MCGIVGAVSSRNIVPVLVEGLKRLEYRGYDSCGVAVYDATGPKRARSVSRVAEVLGSANVLLSNVPGAETPLTFAGYRVTANYPVPIVPPGRFLNVTSRRNAGALDMGVMADSTKIDDIDDVIACMREAFQALERLAAETSPAILAVGCK